MADEKEKAIEETSTPAGSDEVELTDADMEKVAGGRAAITGAYTCTDKYTSCYVC